LISVSAVGETARNGGAARGGPEPSPDLAHRLGNFPEASTCTL
jgi:hypothetical protein